MVNCDIVIPVWNMPEMTKECIDSIKDKSSYPFRLIIVDNGSDDGTARYLKGLESGGAVIIRNDKNLGFAKAVNQGLALSKAPYVCVMNNDTIAADGWLKEMVAVMDSHPDIGVLNPSSNTLGQFSGGERSGSIQEMSTCRGFCMMIRRDVIEKIGFLDESFDIGFFEETDYCKRAASIGYKMARAKAAYVYHKESVSFNKRADAKELFEKNEKIYFSKWPRPVQAAYFITGNGSGKAIDDIVKDIVKNGNKVIVYLKKGADWPVTLDHMDIVKTEVNPIFFEFVALHKILKRRKKKKLEVLMTDSPLFGSVLKNLRFLHGAKILINGKKEN